MFRTLLKYLAVLVSTAGLPVAAPAQPTSTSPDPRAVEIVARTGEDKRLAARLAAIREEAVAIADAHRPGSSKDLAPVLDARFAPSELESAAREQLARSLDPANLDAIEAWAGTPEMMAINAKVRDGQLSMPGMVVPPARRALLDRVAAAMRLPEAFGRRTYEQKRMQAVLREVLIPASNAMQMFDRTVRYQPAEAAGVVETLLIPALQGVEDAGLAKFLEFAESPAGQDWFEAWNAATNPQFNPWHWRLAAELRDARTALEDAAPAVTGLSAVEIVALTGDDKRLAKRLAALRKDAEQVAESQRPGSSADLKQVLDARFATPELEAAVREHLAHGLDPANLPAIEAWARSPGMMMVNAKVRDREMFGVGVTPSPARRALLERLATAMKLQDALGRIWFEQQYMRSVFVDALIPGSGAVQVFERATRYEPADRAAVMETLLIPALENLDDGRIARFLEFAESPAGQDWFEAWNAATRPQSNPWHGRLANELRHRSGAVVDADAEVAPAIARLQAAPPSGQPAGGRDPAAARVAKVLERTGDLPRIVARFAPYRAVIDAQLEARGAGLPEQLKPVLDAHFDGATLSAVVTEQIARSVPEPYIADLERWAEDPDMLAVNAAIFDHSVGEPGTPVPPARRELLERIARKLRLPEILAQQTHDARYIALLSADALQPGARLMDSYERSLPYERPEVSAVVDLWLSPALERFGDPQLEAYAAFAESAAGDRWFAGTFVAATLKSKPWTESLAAKMRERAGSAGADPAAPAAGTQVTDGQVAALVAEAERLLFEEGLGRSLREARSLLLEAEKARPESSRIKSLLGYIALGLRDGPRPGDAELRFEPPFGASFMEEAKRYHERALELDPTNVEALLGLGRIAFLLSEDARALEFAMQAAKLDAEFPGLALLRADIATEAGRYDEAIPLYRMLVTTPQKRSWIDGYALRSARIAHVRAGRTEEYERLADEFLRTHPKEHDAALGHAEYLLAHDGAPAKVMALLQTVPDGWLDERKAMSHLRAVAKQAAAGDDKARSRVLPLAYAMPYGIGNLLQQLCAYPDGPDVGLMISGLSNDRREPATLTLGCAALQDRVDLVEPLVALGADPNALSVPMLGDSPLAAAATFKRPALFAKLIEQGADPERPMRDGTKVVQFIAGDQHESHAAMRAAIAAGKAK